ncbi:MAG: hypothetical protein ACTHMS_01110 [Jatrophihabitans sp.]|uniref:hypothetical protein n=1 Tax=Jatrophihabitans sp. TaxID=1932789 RepID=UPI003F7EDE4C
MASMAVHLTRPPHNVRLEAWGRADDGWWGCVTWRQRVFARGVPDELAIAAWVPAGAITRPAWSQPVELPRVELPASRRSWPAPPGWPYWYAGLWPDGPVPLPPGVELLQGPAWRPRR